jgi:hypothetical protein
MASKLCYLIFGVVAYSYLEIENEVSTYKAFKKRCWQIIRKSKKLTYARNELF